MKVSYNWLQQYIDIPWSPQELADRLTMAGLEVESVMPVSPKLQGVYVGQIKDITPHPNANLQVCQVSLGDKELQLVSGAPNVAKGIKVAVAVEGAQLPNNVTIAAADLRGIISHGMLCSEAELGIGEDDSGILHLPSEVVVGQSLVEALDLDDQILDIDVYANRPDCMSVLGIAREVAALLGRTISCPTFDLDENEQSITDFAQVTVESREKCPRYMARLVKNVRIGASPLWIQTRLRAAGMRPINNVVDITNFVMLETGQPLHAFDLDRLAEKRIVVRTAKVGEKLTTLDGIERELSPEMLMICDATKPICVAGVMGGENSEVTQATENILLESASFSPISVRRTSRSLGISSEAAARFEKGIDRSGTQFALERAAQLLALYAEGQVVGGYIDETVLGEETTIIELRPARVKKLLGVSIPEKEMATILESLEMSVDITSSAWQVTVPSFRRDIELECDLIEEVARIWGYDKIPITLPTGGRVQGGQTPMLQLADTIRQRLVGAGLSEALNYSFIDPRNGDLLQLAKDDPNRLQIPIQNPISEDLAVMRTGLSHSLLETASRNQSRQQSRVNVFEIGAVYLPESLPLQERPLEERRLGILLMGEREPVSWSQPTQEYDFYDIKGLVELIMQTFTADFAWENGSCPFLHPGRQARVMANGEAVAVCGEVHPTVMKNYRLGGRAYLAEVNLQALLPFSTPKIAFKPLPKYPAVTRDMALLLDVSINVGDVMAVLQEAGGKLLQEVQVFDVYQGNQVAEGKKSVAFSFVFQGERTLTDQEVTHAMEKMRGQVESTFGAEIR